MNQAYMMDTTDVINHIYFIDDSIHDFKLQKILYFIKAFYPVFSRDAKNHYKTSLKTNELSFADDAFKAEFKAIPYGESCDEIKKKLKENVYKPMEYNVQSYEEDLFMQFIEKMVRDVCKKSDFSLVDRIHDDQAWFDAYSSEGESKIISQEKLKQEYLDKYPESLFY